MGCFGDVSFCLDLERKRIEGMSLPSYIIRVIRADCVCSVSAETEFGALSKEPHGWVRA